MLYCIQAQVVEMGVRSTQVPTFYLEDSVQGIVSTDHAAQIAKKICNPTGNPNIMVHASALAVELMSY